MRRVFTIVMCVLMAVTVLFGFSGCRDIHKDYEVDMADIFYSTDGGETYRNGPITIPVGESVILDVCVQIESDDGEEHVVKGELCFLSAQNVTISYLKGQKVTPVPDSDSVTYPFEVTTNEDCKLYLEVVPNCTGNIDFELSFDDALPDKYDFVESIKVVEEQEV